MIKVAIVEDEASAAKTLKKYLSQYEAEQKEAFSVDCYPDALAFLDGYNGYDLVFMDIEMPYLNGLEGALRLRKKDREAVLIFVTNMANYAVRGYEADALDFVVKPVSYSDFVFKLQRALRVIEGKRPKEITLVSKTGMRRFSAHDLLYIEVNSHQLSYVLEDEVLEIRGKISEVEDELREYGFLRPHNAYLVNARYIEKVEGFEIRIRDHIIPISRPRRKSFLQELAKWYGKGNA